MATLLKKSMGPIRRQAVDLANFNPVRESLLGDDLPLPLILEPAADQVDLADWARNNHDFIDAKLGQHGGILFRGFGLSTASDFERVASSICSDLYSEYGDLPRGRCWQSIYLDSLPRRQANFVPLRELAHELVAE